MHNPTWQRSSFCSGGGNNCIEVAASENQIAIRESSEPNIALAIRKSALRAFFRGVKAGVFNSLAR